jgi:hypothetical protein
MGCSRKTISQKNSTKSLVICPLRVCAYELMAECLVLLEEAACPELVEEVEAASLNPQREEHRH